MSSRRDALLEHPHSPLGACVEPVFLLLGSDGAHGSWILDLLPMVTFTQDTCAPAFVGERVLASRAMNDPG